MNPRQLGLMMQPETGRIAIVLKKPRFTEMLKDVTQDFVLMQVAEVLQQGEDAEAVVRNHTVHHANGALLEVEITTRIVSRKGASDAGAV